MFQTQAFNMIFQRSSFSGGKTTLNPTGTNSISTFSNKKTLFWSHPKSKSKSKSKSNSTCPGCQQLQHYRLLRCRSQIHGHHSHHCYNHNHSSSFSLTGSGSLVKCGRCCDGGSGSVVRSCILQQPANAGVASNETNNAKPINQKKLNTIFNNSNNNNKAGSGFCSNIGSDHGVCSIQTQSRCSPCYCCTIQQCSTTTTITQTPGTSGLSNQQKNYKVNKIQCLESNQEDLLQLPLSIESEQKQQDSSNNSYNQTKTTSWLPPADIWKQVCLDPTLHSSASTSASLLTSESTIINSGSGCSSQTSSVLSSSDAEQKQVFFSPLQLPYGWETAIDTEGKHYYINHINCSTTYQLPNNKDLEDDRPPQPRLVTLKRDKELGFGFVAGSDRPVIVRFVKEGGPSEFALQAGDQIFEVNGENVRDLPREHVIELIKSSEETVTLVVCQPYSQNLIRKSALLTAAKKARLRTNPSRVRFAEGVVVNGSPLFCYSMAPTYSCTCGSNSSTTSSGSSSIESSTSICCQHGQFDTNQVPIIPNVLKVFLENGQTKTFKYDGNTTVQTVLDSLCEKLAIKYRSYYGLICEHINHNSKQLNHHQHGNISNHHTKNNVNNNNLILLDPNEMIANIASRPKAHNLRCLFRIVLAHPDPFKLLEQDLITFEYFYQQCCNDIVYERFVPEIKYEIAIRLASLHIYEYVLNHQSATSSSSTYSSDHLNSLKQINLKLLDQEYGLMNFVPLSLYESMKRKELIRILSHSMKLNQHLFLSSNNNSTNSSCESFVLNSLSNVNNLTNVSYDSSLLIDSSSINNNRNQPMITALQAKLHFLKILSDLPCYGAKMFSTTRRLMSELPPPITTNESTIETVTEQQQQQQQQPTKLDNNSTNLTLKNNNGVTMTILNELMIVNPKYGLSYMNNLNPVSYPHTVLKIEDIQLIKVTKNEQTLLFDIEIYTLNNDNNEHHDYNQQNNLKNNIDDQQINETKDNNNMAAASTDKPVFIISLDTNETEEFVLFVRAYHTLLNNNNINNNNNNNNNNNINNNNNNINNINININNNNNNNEKQPIDCNLKTLIDQSQIKVIWECTADWWNDGAPRYYGGHKVLSAGWNYPANSDQYHHVDLSVPPPYYSNKSTILKMEQQKMIMKSNNHQCPNHDHHHQIMMSPVTEVVKSIDIRDSQLYTIEEMNLETKDGRPLSIDMPSLISMEILESHGNGRKKSMTSSSTTATITIPPGEETIEQVMQRVNEMNHILSDTEKYLNQVVKPSSLETNQPDVSSNPNSFIVQVDINHQAIYDNHNDDDIPVGTLLESPYSMAGNSNNSEMTIQTPSRNDSQCSASDMLIPKLLQAETDLLDVMNSLDNAESIQDELLSKNDYQSTTIGQSNLQNSLDLSSILPPLIPPAEKEHVVNTSNTQSMVMQTPTSYNEFAMKVFEKPQPPEEVNDSSVQLDAIQPYHYYQQQQKQKTENQERVVAELDLLCDKLQEMQSNLTESVSSPIMVPFMATTGSSSTGTGSTTTGKCDSSASETSRSPSKTPTIVVEDNSEFISNLVIPPPPTESPTLIKEQNDAIKKFWKATDDVKKICTKQQKQKLLEHQQQQRLFQHQQQQKQQWFQQLALATNTANQLTNRPSKCTTPEQQQNFSIGVDMSEHSSSGFDNLTMFNFHVHGHQQYLLMSRPYSSLPTLQQQSPTKSLDEQQRYLANLRLMATSLKYQNSNNNNNKGFVEIPQHSDHIFSPRKDLLELSPMKNVAINSPISKSHYLSSPLHCPLSNNTSDCGIISLSQHPTIRRSQSLNQIESRPGNYYANFVIQNQLNHNVMAYQKQQQNQKTNTNSGSGVSNRQQQQSTQYPKPPIPPSLPSNKEKRLRQREAQQLKFQNNNKDTTKMSNSACSGNLIHCSPELEQMIERNGQISNHYHHSSNNNNNNNPLISPTSISLSKPSLQMPSTTIMLPNNPNKQQQQQIGSVPTYCQALYHHQQTQQQTGMTANNNNNSNNFYSNVGAYVNEAALIAAAAAAAASATNNTATSSSSSSSPPAMITNGCNVSTGPTVGPLYHQLFSYGEYPLYGGSNNNNSNNCSGGAGDSTSSIGSSSSATNMDVVSQQIFGSGGGGGSSSCSSSMMMITPPQYHIPESKRSCFQTKEMEEIFAQCQYDIDTLLARLEEVHEKRLSSPQQTTPNNNSHTKTLFQQSSGGPIGSLTAKETLIVESRHFVTVSKLFVKCATEGSFQLIDYLTECVGLLERMFTVSEDVIMIEVQSQAQITCLVDRLKEVAATYAYTVDVVRRLVSHPGPGPTNPYLDLLMSHATSLATSLCTLMRTLRSMS